MAFVSVKRNGKELFKADVMDSVEKRVRGLMFRKRVETPLFFEFASVADVQNGIHSFFCPVFDAVFLDENKAVASVFEKVAPNKWFVSPGAQVKYLLELEAGTAERLGLKKGEVLEIELESQ